MHTGAPFMRLTFPDLPLPACGLRDYWKPLSMAHNNKWTECSSLDYELIMFTMSSDRLHAVRRTCTPLDRGQNSTKWNSLRNPLGIMGDSSEREERESRDPRRITSLQQNYKARLRQSFHKIRIYLWNRASAITPPLLLQHRMFRFLFCRGEKMKNAPSIWMNFRFQVHIGQENLSKFQDFILGDLPRIVCKSVGCWTQSSLWTSFGKIRQNCATKF